MHNIQEEAVKAAIRAWFEDTRPETVNLSPLPEQDRRMRLALTAAIPFMMNAPCGYRLIPQQPTQTVLEIMAFNLSAEFGADFTRENQEFALAVYNEAWTHGIRPLEPSAARELALEEAHADDVAVDRFAVAMKEKLAKKRAEGRGGWENKDECSAEYLSYLLIQHIWKGDPVDIANLAMMLHQRGERVVIDSETSFIIPDHADAGKVEGHGLPQDVINLVIAAREVWEEEDTLSYYHTDEEFSQRVKALDKALEAFSERVPYENEPSVPASEGAE